jgi:hypothetical protein
MPERKRYLEILEENLLKNLTIALLVILAYRDIYSVMGTIDAAELNNVLLLASIFLVIVCFANFSFTYNIKIIRHPGVQYLSHFVTFLFLLMIAFLLEALDIAIALVYPQLAHMTLVFSLLLYFGLALYDYWDFVRALYD